MKFSVALASSAQNHAELRDLTTKAFDLNDHVLQHSASIHWRMFIRSLAKKKPGIIRKFGGVQIQVKASLQIRDNHSIQKQKMTKTFHQKEIIRMIGKSAPLKVAYTPFVFGSLNVTNSFCSFFGIFNHIMAPQTYKTCLETLPLAFFHLTPDPQFFLVSKFAFWGKLFASPLVPVVFPCAPPDRGFQFPLCLHLCDLQTTWHRGHRWHRGVCCCFFWLP